ncbi:MAG: alpha/beta hydrolase [Azonexaceae bacterium]|nr:alpha/beta hydrolase [Azonexaceae bacterium]
MKWRWLPLLLCVSCAHIPEPAARREQAVRLATTAGWHIEPLQNNYFPLAAFVPDSLAATAKLTVYLEGDGLAWLNLWTPSADPTPVDPLALKLALRDRGPAVYLGRPCQFAFSANDCAEKYWTSHRFSAEVVHAMSQAIDRLKARYAARVVELVGYSGGGAIALLLAAERDDVQRVVTVAGNLDHRLWTTRHRVTPLSGSLNPPDFRERLQAIPQVHYVGGKDRVMMEEVARSYAAGFPEKAKPSIVVIPDNDHRCCWVAQWPMQDNRAE